MNRRRFLTRSSLALTSLTIPQWVTGQEPLRSQWKPLASLPFPVQEIYPAILNHNIHVAGGFAVLPGNRREVTDLHFQYNIASNAWGQLKALPEARHHPNLVACNGSIYALGGFRPEAAGSWVMKNQTWKYDVSSNQWETLRPAPEVHGETVCLAHENKIHVIGGRHPIHENNLSWANHGDVDRHLVFDTRSNTWNSAAPALSQRNSAAGAVINGQFYVVGGRSVSGGNSASLEIYDPREDRWRQAAPMPQGQGGLGAAALNNRLFAFGGEYFGAGGGGVHKETWCYSPATDRWDAVAPMLTPRHGLGAVSDGEFVYAIAGATQAGGNGTSAALERLQIF